MPRSYKSYIQVTQGTRTHTIDRNDAAEKIEDETQERPNATLPYNGPFARRDVETRPH